MLVKDLPKRIKDLVIKRSMRAYESIENNNIKEILNHINSPEGPLFWDEIDRGQLWGFYQVYGFEGDLLGTPIEVVMLMVQEQQAQGNDFNVEVFEYDKTCYTTEGGFCWTASIKGHDFWAKVINYNNFSYFFEHTSERYTPVLYNGAITEKELNRHYGSVVAKPIKRVFRAGNVVTRQNPDTLKEVHGIVVEDQSHLYIVWLTNTLESVIALDEDPLAYYKMKGYLCVRAGLCLVDIPQFIATTKEDWGEILYLKETV